MVRADPATADAYVRAGWWERDTTISTLVRQHALSRPDASAYRWGDASLSWAAYDALADAIAGRVSASVAPGDRVLVWAPDGGGVHAAFLGCERAGAVAVGVGWRAGRRELDHLVGQTGAVLAVLAADTPLGPATEAGDQLGVPVLVLGDLDHAPTVSGGSPGQITGPGIGPSELWLLNSTSGTTGLPKIVMQTQNRWMYFHRKAVEFGALRDDEIWMSVVPAPFGFGLWTAHVTPTMLGAPCVVQAKFDAAEAARAIETHGVTTLCAVSSQLTMILNAATDADLGSLRVVFTGGEPLPSARLAELEERSGACVLNFYGSNETGMLSGTTIDDPTDKRYTTGGRCVPEMNVRLHDPDTGRVIGTHGEGVPACKGPAVALGYWDDDEANAALFTDDGWALMGDRVHIDEDDWLTVIGRTSDFIIRGGKNISAVAVENEVATHPAVALVGVVGKPDDRLGEIAVAFVQLHDGATLTLDDLRHHLRDRGVTVDWWPEELVVRDSLPQSSGGKVAKNELKDLAVAAAND